jgi:hypothetical protein
MCASRADNSRKGRRGEKQGDDQSANAQAIQTSKLTNKREHPINKTNKNNNRQKRTKTTTQPDKIRSKSKKGEHTQRAKQRHTQTHKLETTKMTKPNKRR